LLKLSLQLRPRSLEPSAHTLLRHRAYRPVNRQHHLSRLLLLRSRRLKNPKGKSHLLTSKPPKEIRTDPSLVAHRLRKRARLKVNPWSLGILRRQTDDPNAHRLQRLPNLLQGPTALFDILLRYPWPGGLQNLRQPIV